MMDDRGKSDSAVVPRKPPNNAGAPAAEGGGGKGGWPRGTRLERNALRTQGRTQTRPSALERVRRQHNEIRKQRFTALLHHVYDVGAPAAAYSR